MAVATHTILLVEDDSTHAELIEQAFVSKEERFTLTRAATLAEAQNTASSSLPDLVIADLRLPDGKGVDFIPVGRERGFPVIIMTAFGDERIAVEAMKNGAFDYLVKTPETFDQMPRLAERALREWGHIAERALREWGHIAERKRVEEELRQSAKMESIGLLAGGIAHDFNNILTGINGFAELLMEKFRDDAESLSDASQIYELGNRAADLIKQLLAFSRKQALRPVTCNVNSLVENMSRLLRRMIGEDIDLNVVTAHGLGNVRVDPGQIEQVLMNLAVNARDAMPGGGKLTIETTNAEFDDEYCREHVGAKPGPYVMLALSDTGCGMDDDTRRKVFEPFFTTKATGNGTGLGLATVYGIVKQHGGNIYVYSEPGAGSTFKIYLPIVREAVEDAPEKSSVRDSPRGSETILVVEDEESLLAIAVRFLERLGYTVEAAASPAKAAEVFAECGGKLDLLLTDVVMPGQSGIELYKRLRKQNPALKVLYMSGYTDSAIVHNGMLDPGAPFLQKPFASVSLAMKVREVLDAGAEEVDGEG